MPERGVDDFEAFAVPPREFRADGGMAAVHLVIGRLADVVQQTATSAERAVEADFLGEHAGEKRDFDRVSQDVLRVARAELEPAEVRDQFLVQAGNVRLLSRLLAQLANVGVHFQVGFLDDFLNAGRMNSAVLDQFFEREFRRLAPDVVEAGDDDDSGGVVDDQIDAGRFLERADVAAFAADDPPFHVVGGYVDRAGRRLGGMPGGVALDRGREDFAGLLLACRFNHLIVLQNQAAEFVAQFFSKSRQKQVAGVFAAERRDALEGFELLGQQVVELTISFPENVFADAEVLPFDVEFAFATDQGFEFLVKLIGAFVEASFLFAERFAGLVDFEVEFVSAAESFLLGVEFGLSEDGIGLSAGVFEQLVGDATPGAKSEPRQYFGNGATGDDSKHDPQKDGDAFAKPMHERTHPLQKRPRSLSDGNRLRADQNGTVADPLANKTDPSNEAAGGFGATAR